MSKNLQHELIAELKRIASELGRTPTRDEFRDRCSLGEKAYRREFGGFTPLVYAAGLHPHIDVQSKREKFTYKVQKLESFTVHEVDLSELFRAAGNPPSLKLVAQPDTHVKYRDHAAVSVFLKFLARYRPHAHLIMGDFLDAEGISHWENDSLEPRRFIPEVKEARDLLMQIATATPNAIFRGYITGNHEDWIEQAMAARLPELFDGLAELGLMPDLAKLLSFDEMGIKQFPLNHFVKIGRAYFTHGLYTGNAHPNAHLSKVGANVYYGHLHDTKSATQPSITGVLEAASLGCLCRLDAKFLKGKPTNWVHAFGVFEFFPDGTYTFFCPKIIQGKMSLMGQVFEA